jgi:mitogen-activated protein kinase 15
LGRALFFLHSAEVIHRDIKPANICLNQDCTTKLIDFGSSRTLADAKTKKEDRVAMTDYIATRWYRAPEILLGCPYYDKAVDIWGFGCSLAEFYISRPLFPGTSTLNQLSRIIQVIGCPSQQELESIGAPITYQMFQNLKVAN